MTMFVLFSRFSPEDRGCYDNSEIELKYLPQGIYRLGYPHFFFFFRAPRTKKDKKKDIQKIAHFREDITHER